MHDVVEFCTGRSSNVVKVALMRDQSYGFENMVHILKIVKVFKKLNPSSEYEVSIGIIQEAV